MNKDGMKRLRAIDKEMVLFENITALLEWDQETQMPREGVSGRSEQLVLLQGILHDKITSPVLGELLEELGASEKQPGGNSERSTVDRGMIRQYFREYTREKKIPKRLVEELAAATSKGQHAWAEARAEKNFDKFRPHLETIVSLTREKAEALGFEEHPYDPLLDGYEPGMKTKEVDKVFTELKKEISSLVSRIAEAQQVDSSFLYTQYDPKLQDMFGRGILKQMGFDFDRGILSESAHPFTTSVGPDDFRITTRYNEPSMSSSLFSTIHEGGHALYEMGAASPELKGTILGTGTSLAVHESQSRFWENMIGRSDAFWSNHYPELVTLFPENLKGISEEAFVRGVNKVEPSMIRVNADEVTYSLHVILRFELEQTLILGDLAVKELPDAWNSKMQEMLGIIPADPAEGVLQDVHWSAGLIGYFPTYALGNIFGAQFADSMAQAIPGWKEHVANGELSVLHQWLNEQIYQHGAVYTAPEILERVTGKSLDGKYFADYLKEKYSRIYNLSSL